MHQSPNTLLQSITVATADDLATFWGALMGGGGFGQRTLWLVVLDESGRPTPVVVPIDDIPRVPTTSGVDALGTVVAGIGDFGTVVMLISRPGPHSVQEDDRSWARALTPLVPSWPVHLATADGDGRCRIWSILP